MTNEIKPPGFISILFLLSFLLGPVFYALITYFYLGLAGNPLSTSDFLWFAGTLYACAFALSFVLSFVLKPLVSFSEKHPSKIIRFILLFVADWGTFILVLVLGGAISQTVDLTFLDQAFLALILAAFKRVYVFGFLTKMQKKLPVLPEQPIEEKKEEDPTQP